MEEWDDIFNSMISAIESGELKPGQVSDDAIAHWTDRMMGAVEQGTGKKIGNTDLSKADQKMLNALQSNITEFNAFKNHAEIVELNLALFDEDGQLRTFDDFLKAARLIDNTYNVHYFRAEYNHAINSSMMISRWQQFQEEKEVTPNLRYEAIMDERTRESHRNLNGTVRPIDDPFWNTYFPPNGWNCRCEAIQTDEAATVVPEKKPVLDEMFRRNPGEEMKVFDTDKIPYAKQLSSSAKAAIKAKADALIKTTAQLNKDVANISKVNPYNASLDDVSKGKKNVYPAMNIHEKATIYHYTRNLRALDDYSNYRLNKNLISKNTDEIADSFVRLISSGLKKMPIYRGTVFRAAYLTEQQVEMMKQAMNEDKPYNFGYFMSSSKSFKEAMKFYENQKFMLIIQSKQGRNIQRMSAKPYEREVLFGTDSQFKILRTAHDKIKNIKIFYLEELIQ